MKPEKLFCLCYDRGNALGGRHNERLTKSTSCEVRGLHLYGSLIVGTRKFSSLCVKTEDGIGFQTRGTVSHSAGIFQGLLDEAIVC